MAKKPEQQPKPKPGKPPREGALNLNDASKTQIKGQPETAPAGKDGEQ